MPLGRQLGNSACWAWRSSRVQMVRVLVLKATRSMEWRLGQTVSTVVPTGSPFSFHIRPQDQRPSSMEATVPTPAQTTGP